MTKKPFSKAQQGIHLIKTAIYELLLDNPRGLTNAEIGKQLGIYRGYAGQNKQQGHICRTLLEHLKEDFVVDQRTEQSRKVWYVVAHSEER